MYSKATPNMEIKTKMKDDSVDEIFDEDKRDNIYKTNFCKSELKLEHEEDEHKYNEMKSESIIDRDIKYEFEVCRGCKKSFQKILRHLIGKTDRSGKNCKQFYKREDLQEIKKEKQEKRKQYIAKFRENNREKQRQYNAKTNESQREEKGQYMANYRLSANYHEKQKQYAEKYRLSEKCQEKRKQYRMSEKYQKKRKEYEAKYRMSEKCKEKQKKYKAKYRQTEHGQQENTRYNDKVKRTKMLQKLLEIETVKSMSQSNYLVWKTLFLGFLKMDIKYRPFLDPTKSWTCLNDDPNRGQSNEEDATNLDNMITTLASYGPKFLYKNIINKCTSITNFFGQICNFFGIQYIWRQRGSALLQYNKLRDKFGHDGSKTYQDFYLELKTAKYNTLAKVGSSRTFNGVAIETDEKMTSDIENEIVLNWLEGIDKRLPDFIHQKYSTELQIISLHDIQESISKHLDSHIIEIEEKELGASEENNFEHKNENEQDANIKKERFDINGPTDELHNYKDYTIKCDKLHDYKEYKVKSDKLNDYTDNSIESAKLKDYTDDSNPSNEPEDYRDKSTPLDENKDHRDTLNSDRISLNSCGLKCSKCDLPFKSESKLKIHQGRHHGMKPYLCDQCDLATNKLRTLRWHVKVVHLLENPYQCEDCGKSFSKKCRLIYHKGTHTGERPFQCDECDKSFIIEGLLRMHKRKHTGIAEYICDMCSRAFFEAYSLTKHKKIHSEERAYSCERCDKCFKRSSDLIRHRKQVHTKEDRNYCCVVCGKAFLQKIDLRDHIRVHTGEKPFVCEVCSKSFAKQNNLKIHTRRHTQELPYN